jgi:hypothetical protein
MEWPLKSKMCCLNEYLLSFLDYFVVSFAAEMKLKREQSVNNIYLK